MSKRNRVFIGILLIFALGMGFLLYTVASDLDIRYRESTEQVMVDTANILAAWLESNSTAGHINTENIQQALAKTYQRKFTARIYGIIKQRVDLRVYVTDADGIVLFDSINQDTGKNFRSWHDVSLALRGQYGARTTRNNPADPATTIMYIAVPIYQDAKVIGVVGVSKAVASHRELLFSAQQKLISLGLITLIGFILIMICVSIWLTNPSRLTYDLIQVFKQEKITHPSRLLHRLRTVIRSAFLDMRDAMAGRNYSEGYIQSLTHELKSPLTAIRGAAELLREPMPDAQRTRFTDSIIVQVQRLQDLAERLLKLTSLEKRRSLDNLQPIKLNQLILDVLNRLETRIKKKNITVKLTPENTVYVSGDTFLIQQALTNLLENALDFSPPNSEIEISTKQIRNTCHLTIRDHGQGIPEFALDRIFERFYSLRRPDSGQKSTGLGLPFVREIAHLHGGKVNLANHANGGCIATFSLPLA